MKDKICPKCNRTMSYDPYFKVLLCRQCGCEEKAHSRNISFRSSISKDRLTYIYATK